MRLLGELLQARERVDARVGEHHIQAIAPLPYPLVEAIHVGRDTDVARHRGGVADLGGCLVQLGLAAAGDEHVRAVGRQPLRRGQADPGVAARHHSDLAVELSHFPVPFKVGGPDRTIADAR
ncbi:hypothetical protein FRACA_400032 [Frankia canadensis]|uniref:Uncharacterized protein n=1 Tax=Frankia canadensis TaxID=1836972 RepID=A0A2I2KWR1_9ACTN|nr:hypothetical protein FRACA_400032 [Frankia canadensis]SOU57389.1 hypothetical protein FRACA_400032 [Frankia canadensis]